MLTLFSVKFNIRKKNDILDFFKLLKELELDKKDYSITKNLFTNNIEITFDRKNFLDNNDSEEIVLYGKNAKKINFLNEIIKFIENEL